MKLIGKSLILIMLGILLTACSGQSAEQEKGKLLRIDVQLVDEDGNKGEEGILVDEDDLEAAQNALGNTEWQPNTAQKMARMKDAVAMFFYEKDKNLPESLIEYHIWFEEDDSALLVSNDEDENFGQLNPENAQILKNLFGYE
ncbi:hypothetical protein NCCP2716_28350 [Sporosarcina sp. NCCP-2716]|uniref:hypothetical protein n=1 Tax=Sporosarcina sp. NCCP-2716 TaxID=2943679 RepID=UPI00203F7FE5|nr:hypothetical protein [Sporosarcina sp. NCCP-2716]GKV70337.1 hypothetical protein NCCP2716_28350 [Sporosarcina sp. NCCP-2716]